MASTMVQSQAEWIALESVHLTSRDAGRAMGASDRRVRQVRTGHKRTGKVPVLDRPGRKRKEVPARIVRRVLWARGTYRVGATAIMAILGIPGLSRHTTHRILREHGMVNSAGRRARRGGILQQHGRAGARLAPPASPPATGAPPARGPGHAY